jgi:hypothetical protein
MPVGDADQVAPLAEDAGRDVRRHVLDVGRVDRLLRARPA